jgi:hypothetical protein
VESVLGPMTGDTPADPGKASPQSEQSTMAHYLEGAADRAFRLSWIMRDLTDRVEL